MVRFLARTTGPLVADFRTTLFVGILDRATGDAGERGET